ncbi:hypothetical protein [Brevibacillus fortis]|uniref:Uncharacterized protein n=1 Tax=Brevibacillus fortis TaxID=2126352 RepID=A0A2P7UJW6_9BACL|nr:hypothetical protein [Brevibacillus fortis]PSJ87247.1 hypothetical protein C7R93_27275 [Brevibacillus fortis]
MKVTIDEKVMVASDAIFMKDKKYHFLEVDNTQTLSENKLKIERYKEFMKTDQFQSSLCTSLHSTVAVNKIRMKRFTEMCDGLPVQDYLIDDSK